MKESIKTKETLTTHDAAKLLYVTPTTVIQWIKDGKIKVIRTVGGHRRIPKEELDKFIKDNKMYLNAENIKNVLIISEDEDVSKKITENTFSGEEYVITRGVDLFEAGFLYEQIQPDYIFIDTKIDLEIIEKIYKYIKYINKNTKIIAIVDNLQNTNRFKEFGLDQFYLRK